MFLGMKSVDLRRICEVTNDVNVFVRLLFSHIFQGASLTQIQLPAEINERKKVLDSSLILCEKLISHEYAFNAKTTKIKNP